MAPSRAPLTELSSQFHNRRQMATRPSTYGKHGRKIGAHGPLWSSPSTEDAGQDKNENLAVPESNAEREKIQQREDTTETQNSQQSVTVAPLDDNDDSPDAEKSGLRTAQRGIKRAPKALSDPEYAQKTLADGLQSLALASSSIDRKTGPKKSTPATQNASDALKSVQQPRDNGVGYALRPRDGPKVGHATPYPSAKFAASPEDDPMLSVLLKKSNSGKIISFSDFADALGQNFEITKCAEGSYGDVYKVSLPQATKPPLRNRFEKLGGTILKLIPIGPKTGIGSKKYSQVGDVVHEVKMMSGLDPMPGFARFRDAHVVRGKYPPLFAKAFHDFKDQGGDSENKPPENEFKAAQLFAIIEMNDAGEELALLENITVFQLSDIVWACVITLAIAEQILQFEARDMHVSNILVRPFHPSKGVEIYEQDIKSWPDDQVARFGLTNIRVTIIDYALSRANLDGDIMFYEPKGVGLTFPDVAQTSQQRAYLRQRRAIRDASGGRNKEDWSLFVPKTNTYWLLYLLENFLHERILQESSEQCRVAQEAVYGKLKALQEVLESFGLDSAGDVLKLGLERTWLTEEEVEAYKERLGSEA